MRFFLFLASSIAALFALNKELKSEDPETNSKSNQPINVLFIAIDDLRPELGCYGSELAQTPNIDSFASNAFLFNNAVCSVPVCGASRASVLTGLRPNHDRFRKFSSRADEDAPGIPTIAEWFKSNGYEAISNGKILHKNNDSAEAWSKKPWRPNRDFRDYQNLKNQELASINGHGPATEKGSNESIYADDEVLKKSLEDLEYLSNTEEPFFLAVGFFKPHLPFCAPAKFWDLYDNEDIGLASNRFAPENIPEEALHSFGELRAYLDIPDDENIAIPDSMQNLLRHGYFACVSYVDHLVGQLIAKLDELQIAENTIVVIWGDHGWQLGEHDLWAKHCNFQTSLKVPLLVRYPGQEKGAIVSDVVELIDLYPTICAATGTVPPNHVAGIDLSDITGMSGKPMTFMAFSKFHGGETVTSNEFSYTEFRDNHNGNLKGTMLFNLLTDPQENHNLSGTADYTAIQEKMKIHLDSLRTKAGIAQFQD